MSAGVSLSLVPTRPEWLDVCLKNAVTLLEACRGLDVDPCCVYDALPAGIGRTRRELARAWVSLDEFNVIIESMLERLGHPDCLTDVGRYASEVAFGSEALGRWFLRAGVRHVTDPGLGLRQLPRAARLLNTNKSWYLIHNGAQPRRELVKITYDRGPGGEPPRTPLDDVLSLLFFARGNLEAVAPLWSGQPRVGFVRYRLVDLDPVAALRRLMPEPDVELPGDRLRVDGREVGQVVYLVPSPDHGGEYVGDHADARPADGQPFKRGVLITSDIVTPNLQTGEMRPLLRRGEIFAHPGEPIGGTVVELRWRAPLLSRLLGRLFRPLTRTIDSEMARDLEEATAHQQIASTNQRLQVADQYLERRFPNRDVARAVLHGTFKPLRVQTGVLLLDVCGFTVKSWKMRSTEMAATVRRFAARMIAVAQERGGWFYKFTGDGGIFIFADRFDRPTDSLSAERAQAMVHAARAMVEIAHRELGWDLRVGLNVGPVTWYVLEEGFSFEGTGIGIDMAARLEQACPNGGILASDELARAAGEPSLFGPAQTAHIKGEHIARTHPVL